MQVVEKTKTRKQRAVKPFGQAYHNDTVTLEKLKDKKSRLPKVEDGISIVFYLCKSIPDTSLAGQASKYLN